MVKLARAKARYSILSRASGLVPRTEWCGGQVRTKMSAQ